MNYDDTLYDNHSHFDHLSQQQNLIEAIDSLVLEPSTEQFVDYDELQ